MESLDRDVRRLARAVFDLMRQSAKGWVTWTQVTKQLVGYKADPEYWSALASLPQYQYLFAKTLHKVKLTDQGLAFVSSFSGEGATMPARIAEALIRYARKLPPIVLQIESLAVLAKAGNKVVHAVAVELSDDVLPTETPVEVRC